jgi:hypothetical protein
MRKLPQQFQQAIPEKPAHVVMERKSKILDPLRGAVEG